MESKTLIDVTAVTGGLASWLSLLPEILSPLAALFSCIWLGLRIWETDTIRKLLRRD